MSFNEVDRIMIFTFSILKIRYNKDNDFLSSDRADFQRRRSFLTSSLKIRSVAFLVILGYRRLLFRCSKSTRSFFRLLLVITVAFPVAFLVIHSGILGQKQP